MIHNISIATGVDIIHIDDYVNLYIDTLYYHHGQLSFGETVFIG